MKSSPTHDLLYGKPQGWDKHKVELYLITFSTKEEPTSKGAHDYDASNPSVRNLARMFKEIVIYLHAKHSDEVNLAILMALNLDVLSGYHVNAYCYFHMLRLLLMAQVALVYIKYLAMPSLLLLSCPNLPYAVRDCFLELSAAIHSERE